MRESLRQFDLRAAALFLCLALLIGLFSAPALAEEGDPVPAEPAEESAEPSPEPTPEDGIIPLIEQEEWWLGQDWDTLRPFYGAEYGWLRLELNVPQLEQVGHQFGGQACACYSLAYCRTLLDGRAHDIQEFNLGFGEADAYCAWYAGSYDSLLMENASDVFERMYQELCAGKPLAVLVKGPATGQHYVAVVGFENVENGKPLTASNFLIFDPCTESFDPENMGERGFMPKRTELGLYQLLVDTSAEAVRTEAHESSYLSGCRFYRSSRLAVTLQGAELRSLPCREKVEEESEVLAELKPGWPVYITALVKNRAGEFWYRAMTLSGEIGYVEAASLSAGVAINGGVGAEEIKAPSLLTEGDSFALSGRLYAGRHSFSTVCVAVYAGSDLESEPLMSATMARELGFCKLELTALSKALAFETLAPGDYSFVITVTCPSYFSVDGEKLMNDEAVLRPVILQFTVAAPEEE